MAKGWQALLATFAISAVSALPSTLRHATLLSRATDVKETYDYVVVGGGTAGLTVADRLTEDGKCTSDSADPRARTTTFLKWANTN